MQTTSIQISAAGATPIVPARDGFEVHVCAFSLSALPLYEDVAYPVWGLVKWQSSGGTDLTGFRKVSADGMAWDFGMTAIRVQRPDPYFKSLPGEGLSLFQEPAFDCGGFVAWEYVRV